MKLVVLESPNKVKKVAHYLGAGYEVVATAGHFRDLPRDALGVDLRSFDPDYVVDPQKKDLLARIKAKAKAADEVLLATDIDREGEAISWHLAQELHLKRPMRLLANEITEKAIKDAAAHLVPLDQHRVDAQQARRVFDRLVGYQVSPLLSRRFGKGNSAGRVQSATLHLVVLRELAREHFNVELFWTLAALYKNTLRARYATVGEDGTLADTRFKTEAEAASIAERARAAKHVVKSVDTQPTESRPNPPFTTSTLQQAAAQRLHFTPDNTMALAQKLFEAGLISYHRTDSVALSDEAIQMARHFIAKDFPEALPTEPVRYKLRANAQGAHEAIRPTSLEPEASIALAGDDLALYHLIRRSFIACQCKPAVLSRTTITIEAGDTTWRAMGSVVLFESFRRYLAADDAADASEKDEDQPELPKVAAGDVLELEKIDVQAKQTKPPPRYTQASLIKAMEKTGIGRPATYANTVTLLFDRSYIAEEKDHIFPTTGGRRIDSALGQTFPEILETETTAQLEKTLDEIEQGSRQWKAEIRDWYGPFSQRLAAAEPLLDAEAAKYPELAAAIAAASPKPTGKKCPLCGKELLLRKRNKGDGQFLSCSGYPECTYAANPDARPAGKPCPACGKDLLLLKRKDGSGDYLACSGYPTCRYTGNPEARESGRKCPRCARDLLLVKRSDEEGEYLSCSGRNLKDAKGKAACDYTADPSVKPSDRSCPECHGPMEELSGKFGPRARCLKPSCHGVIDLSPISSEKCPVCDGPMLDKVTFLRCTNHPACKGSYDKAALQQARREGTTCPDCGKPLLQKKGARGPFIGCSAYPKCKYIAPTRDTRRRAS